MTQQNNREALIKSALLEVLLIDDHAVLLGYKDGQAAGLMVYPVNFCPEPARMVGGCFYLDKFKAEGTQDYVFRTRSVDPGEEAKILEDLFRPLEK